MSGLPLNEGAMTKRVSALRTISRKRGMSYIRHHY